MSRVCMLPVIDYMRLLEIFEDLIYDIKYFLVYVFFSVSVLT